MNSPFVITVNHVHAFPPSPDLTAQLNRIEKAMADANAAVLASLDVVKTHLTGLTGRVDTLQKTVDDLRTQVENSGQMSQAVKDAFDAVDSQIDAILPEVPTAQPGPAPAPSGQPPEGAGAGTAGPPATDPNAPPPAGSGSSPAS